MTTTMRALLVVAVVSTTLVRAKAWECTPPELPLPECHELDELLRHPEFGRYFSGERAGKEPDCDLAVINAGMPRTGSTLLELLALDAMTLVVKQNDASQRNLTFKDCQFWRFNRHMGNLTWFWRLPPVPPGTDIVYVKSHEWDSELITLCKRNLVLLTMRDPAAMALSEINAFHDWGANVSCDDAKAMLEFAHKGNSCWQQHADASLKFSYERMKANKASITTAIAATLAEMLEVPAPRDARTGGSTFELRFPARYHTADANPLYPGTQAARLAADDADRALRASMKATLPDGCNDPDIWRSCFTGRPTNFD